MNEDNLVHCIYTSSLSAGFDHSELNPILEIARENNKELEVSGMLLFDDGSFFQILEGQPSVVDDLYSKISKDVRHEHLVKLIYEDIEERDFSDWSMGIAQMTRNDLTAIPGMNDFFTKGRSLFDLDKGRAKSLLDAFRKGRYRTAIT